jgi:hypothetical protein
MTLADGRILLNDGNGSGQAVTSPKLEQSGFPWVGVPQVVVSRDATRVIVADGQGSSTSKIYSYDVESLTATEFRTLGSSSYFYAMLAISADGERFVHATDVYDRSLSYLGTLDVTDGALQAVTLSGNGQVAVAVMFDSATNRQVLRSYDVRGSKGPFPAFGAALDVPPDTFGTASRLFVDGAGRHVFLFTLVYQPNSGQYDAHLVVRALQPLTP